MDTPLVIAGKYHVVQLIAQGGMGAVYDAVHARTGRRVALKLVHERALSSGSAALLRFEREAKAAGAIESQHVVQVLDAGEDEASGMPFIAMEFLEGEDLRQSIARGPLPPAEAVAIAEQVCLALVKAHEAGIIHRDLKPANLFLAASGDDQKVVKLLDFGIAKLLHEAADGHDLTRTGDMIGSPPYMSPEQLASPDAVDHRTDLWSLGVVLYEMLSGVTPTAHLSVVGARVYAICHVPAMPLVERVPGIDPELSAFVRRALALDVAARFASAEEMLDALRALAAPKRRAPRPWLSSVRGRTALAASAALLVSIGSIGAYASRNAARGATPTHDVARASAVVAPTSSTIATASATALAIEPKSDAPRPQGSVAAPRPFGGATRTFPDRVRAKLPGVDAGASTSARAAPPKASTGREEL